MICVLFSLPLCPVFFCLVFLLGMDDLAHVLHVYAAHGIDETNMELMLRNLFLLFARFRTFRPPFPLEFSNNTYCLVLFSL